jgi:hypothetical protein
MLRSKPFTGKVWDARRLDQDRVDKEAFRRADEPTKDEIFQDKVLAEDLIRILVVVPPGNPSARSDLIIVLAEARLECSVRKNIKPDGSLPVIGGIQPTHGEMRATLKAGLKHAKKLRDWYRALPSTLLSKATVPFAEGGVLLGIVIEQLTETLELANKHKRHGRPPGSRAVAQSAARYLVRYMRKHAPKARAAKRKEFMFAAARALEITCPDLDDDPSAFNEWFREVEAIEPRPPDPKNGA